MSELRSPSPASCGRSLDGWSDHSAARWGQALADHLPRFWKKQVKSNVFSLMNSLPHYLCYKCNCPFKAFSNQSLCAWSVASLCVWFSWEMGLRTMPGICFQQLSHSWETQHLPHLKVCQHQTTSECACCVFMFTRMGPRGVDWLRCSFIHLHFLWCSWERSWHLRRHCSSAVPLRVHIPYVMLTLSIMHLTTANLSVFMTFIERTGCISEKAENANWEKKKKSTLILDLLNCI